MIWAIVELVEDEKYGDMVPGGCTEHFWVGMDAQKRASELEEESGHKNIYNVQWVGHHKCKICDRSFEELFPALATRLPGQARSTQEPPPGRGPSGIW